VNAGNRDVTGHRAAPVGTLRYWAAAREAAGTSEEPYAAHTLAQAVADAVERHGEPLRRVLARCAFVVDGTPVSRRDPATVELTQAGTIEVLPPFAGGAAATAAAMLLGDGPTTTRALADGAARSATMPGCRPC
jgi:molybdopterin synthase sulfur carrier subunit